MKTFSPIKFFTPVCFVLVMGFVSAGLAEFNRTAQDFKTEDDCNKFCSRPTNTKLNSEEKEVCIKGKDTNDGPNTATDKCLKLEIANCKEYYSCDKLPTKKDQEAKCDKAFEKYDKESEDLKEACDSMDADSSKTCRQRIDSCESRGGSAGPKGSNAQQFTNLMMSAYMQKNGLSLPNDPEAKDANALNSCTDFTNDKTEKARDKFEQKQDKLKQKIADLKKSISEEREKRDNEVADAKKENNEIEAQVQKVREKVKEAIRKVDEKKGERMRKLNEDIAKSAIAIRNINNAIIKQKELSESVKFDYAQKVVQFSEDKVSKQCKAAVETAKACFVKSSKGQKSTDPKDTCSNFSLTAKGAKGTAELKQKLKDIQDACFEQAKLSTDKARFEQQKSLRSIETDITEKTNQVKDAQNDLERRQNDFKSIGAESDKEKSDEENNANTEIDNLAKKTANVTEKMQTANARRELRMKELEEQAFQTQNELAASKLEITNTGESFKSTFSEARRAIKRGEAARLTAIDVCCPDRDVKTEVLTKGTKNNDPRCGRLVSDGKETKSSGRSTKGAEGQD